MRQCMRCGKACPATFCDDCRSFLQGPLQNDWVASANLSRYDPPPSSAIQNPVTPLPAVSDMYAALGEYSILAGKGNPVTPLPPVNKAYASQAERALRNLQDAARRIAAVEQNERRSLHASRLSPMYDISADIQRKSTSVPRLSRKNKEEEIEDLGDVPDLWTRFSADLMDDEDEDEDAKSWDSSFDPLLSRRFPRRAEAVRIEEEDRKRAVSDGLAITAEREIFKRVQEKRRLRWLFIGMAVVAGIILIVDIVLVSLVWGH